MSSQLSTEADLIERLKRRDPEALASVYDRYGSLAYSLLMRITRDKTAAEDLLQELFIRLWNRSRDFDPSRGALGVWIVAIARNMAIDYLRSAKTRFSSRLRSIDLVDPLLIAQRSGEPESLLDRARTVKTALSNLTPNEKRVLEMAYYEGFSQTEIATRLNEPLGTVKTWMRSGLGRLRLAMKTGAAQ
jgi:RNA polymerase sigma-70 factor (ECF subfamily)